MKLGPNGQPDEASLMAGVNSMLSQMMSGGAGNPFAALLGGGTGESPRRALPPSGKKKKNIRK